MSDHDAPARKRKGRGRSPTRAELADQQRGRILEATLEATGVGGYDALSVGAIVAAAEVSRGVFYWLFANKEEAFLALYEQVATDLLSQVELARDPSVIVESQMTACLVSAVSFLLADPVRAEVVLLEVHAAGADAVAAQETLVGRIVRGVAAMLAASDPALPVGEARRRAAFAVGGVREILRSRLIRDELDRLPELVPELTQAILPAMLTARAPSPCGADGGGSAR